MCVLCECFLPETQKIYAYILIICVLWSVCPLTLERGREVHTHTHTNQNIHTYLHIYHKIAEKDLQPWEWRVNVWHKKSTLTTNWKQLLLKFQTWYLHTATHRSTPQHTATHRNTPQHTTAHCNTPQHTATHQLKATTPEKKFKRGICRRVLHIRRHLTTQMKTPNYTYEHTYIFIRTVVKKYVSFAHRLAACTHILNKESEPIWLGVWDWVSMYTFVWGGYD